MSKQKHTPGPWVVENPMEPELWIVQGGKEPHEWEPIATCPWPDEESHMITSAQVKANAHLIAAAPGLYALAKAFGDPDISDAQFNAMREAAIAKAEGRGS